MISELDNQLYRLRHLYACREEGSGKPLEFTPRPEQEMLYKHFIETPHIPAYIVKSRRLGISTAVDIFEADCAAWISGFRGFIIDKTQPDATKKMVEIVRFALEHLPPEILANICFDKKNDGELRLRMYDEMEAEDSAIFATVGGRGGDCNMLHVSEWGPIAATDPKRSNEIRTGAFPAARKGLRVVETTWYGGKSGELWEMIAPIMRSDPNAEGILYFFPWHADPQAVKFDGEVSAGLEDYFRTLAEKLSKRFSQEQKLWYAAKKLEQGMYIKREYPSTLAEALSAPMAGAIYDECMDELRERKRIHDFAAERMAHAFTFWDIGLDDYGCIWLAQFVGRDILLLDYCTSTDDLPTFYTGRCAEWERKHNVTILKHYLPHDADTRDKTNKKTYRVALIEAGLDTRSIVVVPRTPDIWLGVNAVRGIFPRFYIHATNCGQQVAIKGQTLPSGIECLDYYHKRLVTVQGGVTYEDPVHDQYSHGASALRTMGEAHRLGMLEGVSVTAKENRSRPVTVLRGPGPESYGQPARRRPNVIR